MPRTQLLSKRQSETHIVEFEFREQLTFGESLSTPVVTVGVFTGFDYDTAALLSGGATVSGTVVSQLVTAGMAGAIYSLTCEVTGSSGNVYRTTRRLAVLSDVGGFAAGALPSLTGSLPDGVVGAPYLEMLDIAGGYPPYSPEGIIAGAPSWMGFSVLDDVLVCAGTPDETVATTYNFSPEIFDQALNHAVSPQSIDITRIIVVGAAPDSTVGGSVDFFYTADFGTPPYSFPTQPVGFPPAWTLGSDGHVTGTSTVEGSYSWEVLGVDANGITDTHPDDAVVAAAPTLYLAVDNTMAVTRSLDQGASFTDPITTGLSPGTSNVSLCSAGGILYHLGASNGGKYSVSGDSGTFNDCTGLITTPGAGLMFKFGNEWQLYAGLSTMSVSTDGVSFSTRTVSGGVANTVRRPVFDGNLTVLAIGSGHRLMYSTNIGTTFFEYTNADFNTVEGIQFVLHIPGVGYRSFGITPGNLQIIGSAVTPNNAAAWTYAAAPEQAALTANIHGVARNPTTGRVVMVLRNGHTWYSDDNCASWTAGPNFTYTNPLNFGPPPGNAFTYNDGFYYFCTTQSAGVTTIQRIPEDMSAWTQVYSIAGGNAVNTMCAH